MLPAPFLVMFLHSICLPVGFHSLDRFQSSVIFSVISKSVAPPLESCLLRIHFLNSANPIKRRIIKTRHRQQDKWMILVLSSKQKEIPPIMLSVWLQYLSLGSWSLLQTFRSWTFPSLLHENRKASPLKLRSTRRSQSRLFFQPDQASLPGYIASHTIIPILVICLIII